MIFKDPVLLSLIPVSLIIFFYIRRTRYEPGFLFPSDDVIKKIKESLKLKAVRGLPYLRLICIMLVIVAMARPMVSKEANIRKEGIAMALTIDCSSTMLAEDLGLSLWEQVSLLENKKAEEVSPKSKRINRLDAVKEVAKDFIKNRPDDLIGIVAFAAEAFIACPLTFDQEWLYESLDRIKVGIIKDGTAIGSGILSSLNQLENVRAKSKAIILLSDGINNFGNTPPIIAAKAARAIGIKIYTIGIVSKWQVPYPSKDSYGRTVYKNVTIPIREDILQEIATLTGGKYFRVTDMNSLKESYKEIDLLEKAPVEEKSYDDYQDIFYLFLIPALGLLLLEIISKNTFLRKIP